MLMLFFKLMEGKPAHLLWHREIYDFTQMSQDICNAKVSVRVDTKSRIQITVGSLYRTTLQKIKSLV
jgi:hypothetical protein